MCAAELATVTLEQAKAKATAALAATHRRRRARSGRGMPDAPFDLDVPRKGGQCG